MRQRESDARERKERKSERASEREKENKVCGYLLKRKKKKNSLSLALSFSLHRFSFFVKQMHITISLETIKENMTVLVLILNYNMFVLKLVEIERGKKELREYAFFPHFLFISIEDYFSELTLGKRKRNKS